MEKMKIFIIYIIFQSFISSQNSDIVFVFEHVRHGARSPLFYDGNTNYDDHFGTIWEGASVLTEVGKRTHYAIGIHNRLKYSSLINFSKFDYKEIELYSTNSGRVLQSVQAELLAMYLPGTLRNLSEDELKAALPPFKNISSEVSDEIKLLNSSTIIDDINVFPIKFSAPEKTRLHEPESCPYMANYTVQLKNEIQDEINLFLKDFDEQFGEDLQQYLNKPNRDFAFDFDFVQIILADEYISNYYNGNNFSDFKNKTKIDTEKFLKYCQESKNFYIFHLNLDEKTGVMSASPQMRDIINYMENIINNKTNTPKMVIHGGHDNTINYFQYFMHNVFNFSLSFIPFASSVYFELHKNGTTKDDYYVEYIYNGESLMKMKFNEFKDKVMKAVWSDEQIKNFCYPKEEGTTGTDNDDDNKTLIIILIATSSVFFVLTLIFFILFILYYKKSKNYIPLGKKDALLTSKGSENNELEPTYSNY